MRVDHKVRLRIALQSSVFVILVVVLVGLLAVAAREFRAQWDVTSSGRNTQLAATPVAQRRKLHSMDAPVGRAFVIGPQDRPDGNG